MYEWIKYKVAAEIGGQEEREALSLYEKMKLDEHGPVKFKRLFSAIEKKDFLGLV